MPSPKHYTCINSFKSHSNLIESVLFIPHITYAKTRAQNNLPKHTRVGRVARARILNQSGSSVINFNYHSMLKLHYRGERLGTFVFFILCWVMGTRSQSQTEKTSYKASRGRGQTVHAVFSLLRWKSVSR